MIRAVMSGQLSDTHMLFRTALPVKEHSRLLKALDSSDSWSVENGTVWNVYGFHFHGVASWGGDVTLRTCGWDHRFRILHLDRFNERTVYAVPVGMLDNLSKLPGTDVSKSETVFLKSMADELADKCSVHDTGIILPHPAKDTIFRQTALWDKCEPDKDVLSDTLEKQPILLHVSTAALDAQLRALKKQRMVPSGVYNFVLDKKDLHAGDWLASVLNTMTFVNESGRFGQGAILLRIQGADDLDSWEKSPGRLTLLQTATGNLLRPLLDKIEEDERIRKSGGDTMPVFSAVPISVCRHALCSPFASDIELSVDPEPLTCQQQDALRAAMCGLLTKNTAESLYTDWKDVMRSPEAYRLDGFKVWQDILRAHIVHSWFQDDSRTSLMEALIEDVCSRQEQEEAERKAALMAAYELVSTPEQYNERIIPRPATKKEALARFAAGASAIRYSPERGEDAGKMLLAFTKSSLLGLIEQVGCGEELYTAFIDLCTQNGILNKVNHPLKLGSETLNAVIFHIEE